MVSAICKGSTHDSLAHSVSSLGRFLAAGLLNKDFWVAGDEAYSCDESLLTPFPASMIRGHPFRDAYNFFQSSLRIHVEQAFGFLVSKWRILRELEYSLEVCIEIIMVTMMLHNYCIARNGRPHRINNYCSNSLELLKEEKSDWYRIAKEDNLEMVEMMRDSLEADLTRCSSKRREKMVALLEKRGILRP